MTSTFFARSAVVIACATVAVSASAQRTITVPHVLESSGAIIGIAWDLSGGQPGYDPVAKRQVFLPMAGTYALGVTDGHARWILSNVNGHVTPLTTVATRIPDSPRQAMAYGIELRDMIPIEVTLPGGDTNMSEVRKIGLKGSPDDLVRVATPVNPDAKQTAKKQKQWLCSNFRVRIGDLPCERISRFDDIVLTRMPTGDLDGDGVPDFTYDVKPFGFEIPSTDAKPYQEQILLARGGTPKELPLLIEYLDEDGFVIRSIEMMVVIDALGPADMLDDPATTSRKIDYSRFRKAGHVTLMK